MLSTKGPGGRLSKGRGYCLVVAMGLLTAACVEKPYSPAAQQALSTFTIEEGFKIELVVSEPMVADPVAMEIDERGRIYVVEMHGYPLDVSGTGKIKLLTDNDGDGQIDECTVFAEGLVLPTGIMRWRQGVIVTDPPNVLYLEDRDGDGKADIKEVLLTGFAVSNPQHNSNNPLFGLDNWIYVGNEPAISTTVYKDLFGGRGEAVRFPGRPDGPALPQNAGGRSIRFNPDGGQLEMLASKTQFGHTFDAWGHRLLVNNSNHIIHEVIPAAYLDRNPDLVVPLATHSASDHGNAAEVFPTTINPELQMLSNVGVMTSACGIIAYLGGAFPEGYNDDVTFVAEPVSNLVHADKLRHKGATFTASRMQEKREFLTSTDSWFRPVNMYVGPDGALYVLDYYRQIIEHPEWMSDEVNRSGALYNGTDMGRIYRVSAVDAPPMRWTRELRALDLTTDLLVEKLSDPNIWWRRTAQRLLLDRKDEPAVPKIRAVARGAKAPLGRLHALWTLEGIGQLTSDDIRMTLQDSEGGVRENAIRLAELHLKEDPSLGDALFALKDDPHPKVAFQLLASLGSVPGAEADKIRRDLLFAHIEDPWMQIAALSAPDAHRSGLLEAVLARFSYEVPAHATLVQRLSAMTGASQDQKAIHGLIRMATSDEMDQSWQGAVLRGLADGLRAKKPATDGFEAERNLLVDAFFSHRTAAVRSGALDLLKVIGLQDDTGSDAYLQRARRIASDQKLSPQQRAQAVEFLALRNPAPFSSLLKDLIRPGEPLPVQVAAIRTLSAIPDLTVSEFVLERWASLSPEVRDEGLDSFLANANRVRLLLDAIEDGTIPQSVVGFYRSVRLRTQSDVTLRNRARELFSKQDEGRQQVIESYKPALELSGDVARGEEVFKRSCSICHQVRGGLGTPYGPDLGTVHNWPPMGILTHILDPNLSISDGFDMWEITLNSGETVQGIIATETPSALTLRNAGGQETTIARQDISSLKTLGISTMPTGLEAQIDRQAMADLLAFLRRVE